MTRYVLISDIHGCWYNLKEPLPHGDILLVSGDTCALGRMDEITAFCYYINSRYNYNHKILIAGNHDAPLETLELTRKLDYPTYKARLEESVPGFHYLCDDRLELDGVVYYGSPYTPNFFNWSFMMERGEPLREKWSHIPDDTEILLTHGAPFGVLDDVRGGGQAGDVDLMNRIRDLTKLRLHSFGHLHLRGGNQIVGENNTRFVNASVCDEDYYPTNPIMVVDL